LLPFRIVIVREMWLTEFDAPSLHTIYVDKPMKWHGLMQAIPRANLRRLVRRVLRKHGYPPDTQDAATDLVIAQAELMGAEWAR
jgi:type I site-specific restriction-modification system R (restriction) subunit